MRYYQWSDPSYEARRFAGRELTFVDDLLAGGCLLICGFCKEEIKVSMSTQVCPKCSKDLIFPRSDW